MIPVLLLAALVGCDSALTALLTPAKPGIGRYEVCTSDEPLDEVVRDRSRDGAHYAPSDLLEALDAFGAAGTYDRGALARLYGGRRVRVVRGWIQKADRFESTTLISPYPDAALTRLNPGTMIVTWTLLDEGRSGSGRLDRLGRTSGRGGR